jgi:hypothetical protein
METCQVSGIEQRPCEEVKRDPPPGEAADLEEGIRREVKTSLS